MAIDRVKEGEKITAVGYNQLVDAANANSNFYSNGIDFVHSKNGTTLKTRNDKEMSKLKVPRPFDCRLTIDPADPNTHYFQVFDPIDHAKLFGTLPQHWWIWNGTEASEYDLANVDQITKWATLSGNFTSNWNGVQLVALTCYEDQDAADKDQKTYGYMFADTAYQNIPNNVELPGVLSAAKVNSNMIMVSYKLATQNKSEGKSNSFRIINCQGGELNWGTDADLSNDNSGVIPDSVQPNIQLSSIGYALSNDNVKVIDLYKFDDASHIVNDINEEFGAEELPEGDVLYRQYDLLSQPGLSAKILNYIPLCSLWIDSDTTYSRDNLRENTPQRSIEHKARTPFGKRTRKVDQLYKYDDRKYVYNQISALKKDYKDQQDLILRAISADALSGDANVLTYLSLSCLESTPDSMVDQTSCFSLDKDGKDHSLELYKFSEMEEKAYSQVPASDLAGGKSDLVFRHKVSEGDTKVEYMKLTDVAHFGDNELNAMGKAYAPTDISSTEVFSVGGTDEKIIRIHGFKDKPAVDVDNLEDVNQDILLRQTNQNSTKEVQYLSLSSVYSPTDSHRSDVDAKFKQHSIEDKDVDGKKTRQLKSFDDISNDKETIESLSSASSATLLVRKQDSNGKNLKYIDLTSLTDIADSDAGVGLSSIEKRTNSKNQNYYSFFQFGTANAKQQKSNLSNGLSTELVVRVKDGNDFRHVEYAKLSVEYPFGDADVQQRNSVGSIAGPSLQVKGANGNQADVPQGSYQLNQFETTQNDLAYNQLSTKAECYVLLRTKDQGSNIHNLNYTDIRNLCTEVSVDSDLDPLVWGDRKQESLDKFNWSALVGKDGKNVLQLHNFNKPVFRSPSYLSNRQPAVLVRSDYPGGIVGVGRYVSLEYVPLSALSAIPADTSLTSLNQKSIEYKHQGYGEDSENYFQLRRFDEGTGDYTLDQLSANINNIDVLVRDRSSGELRELKYAALSNFQLSGESEHQRKIKKNWEWPTDISGNYIAPGAPGATMDGYYTYGHHITYYSGNIPVQPANKNTLILSVEYGGDGYPKNQYFTWTQQIDNSSLSGIGIPLYARQNSPDGGPTFDYNAGLFTIIVYE